MTYERRFIALATANSTPTSSMASDPDDIVKGLLSGAISPMTSEEEFVDHGLHYYSNFSARVCSATAEWRENPLSETHPQSEDVFRGLCDYHIQYGDLCAVTFKKLLLGAWYAAHPSFMFSAPRYYVRVETIELASRAIASTSFDGRAVEYEKPAVCGRLVARLASQDFVRAVSPDVAMDEVAYRMGYTSVKSLVLNVEYNTTKLVQVKASLVDGGEKANRRLQLQINRKGSKLSLARRVERGELEVGAMSAFMA